MIAGLIAGLATAVVLWLAGVPLSLGAHPFWAEKVIWIGAPVGLILFAISTRATAVSQIIMAVVIGMVALVAAYQGKTVFAASYAENALAGQAWYVGWIAVCCGAVMLAAALVRLLFRQ